MITTSPWIKPRCLCKQRSLRLLVNWKYQEPDDVSQVQHTRRIRARENMFSSDFLLWHFKSSLEIFCEFDWHDKIRVYDGGGFYDYLERCPGGWKLGWSNERHRQLLTDNILKSNLCWGFINMRDTAFWGASQSRYPISIWWRIEC